MKETAYRHLSEGAAEAAGWQETMVWQEVHTTKGQSRDGGVSEPMKLANYNYARLRGRAGRDKHHSLPMFRGR